MVIDITLKDPDGVSFSLEQAGLDENDLPEDVEKALKKFVRWNEYVTIQIDTEQQTAKVIPVK